MSEQKRKKPHRARRMILWSLLALFIASALSVWLSYTLITTTSYAYETPKLSQPITIVQLSDLHCHLFGFNNAELIRRVRQEEPDLITITGDVLNYYSESDEYLLNVVQQLSQIAPVYFTVGNHDVRYMVVHKVSSRLEGVERAGAVVLNGSYADIVIRGQHLRIGGLYDYVFNKNQLDDAAYRATDTYRFLTAFENTDAFKLLLIHQPNYLINEEANARWDIDLALCGHEHGGQVRLPLLGGFYSTHLGWFTPYLDGATLINGIPTLITRGLSSYIWMSNGLPAPPRFCNPPELVRIQLNGTSATDGASS
ncbi:MAG: metallophosphoesterase [Clostridia bacterium]